MLIQNLQNTLIATLCLFTILGCSEQQNREPQASKKKYVLVIHGGAGTILKENMSPEKEMAYRTKLTEALEEGYRILQEGKSSIDAVQKAINIMEDSPLFNAGKGAVFTHNGKNEMDASIMNGGNRKAGAVAGVTTVKNPIDAARAVMEQSEHVMLSGRGANQFAKKTGCSIVDTAYFFTQKRWDYLQHVLSNKTSQSAQLNNTQNTSKKPNWATLDKKFGTVGCVALDKKGNLAAGTSTGGMTNKKYGRIGDSPIIGAGTYCNNLTAGISATGWGEYYIREVAAHRVSDLIELKNMTLEQAVQQTLKEIAEMGGNGGMIGLNTKGEYTMQFNTKGMYRGVIDKDGNVSVLFYK